MKLDNILPENFDGTFKFTNYTEEPFVAKWDGIEYTFPPLSTTPLIIGDQTPLQIQNIRKKFAHELGVQEFYKSSKFGVLNKHVEGGTPAPYTDGDIAPFVQRCLEPLPIAQISAKPVLKDPERNLKKDTKGNNVTRALDEGESLGQPAEM